MFIMPELTFGKMALLPVDAPLTLELFLVPNLKPDLDLLLGPGLCCYDIKMLLLGLLAL